MTSGAGGPISLVCNQRLRIRGGITTSNLLFVPSPRHGLISLVPWDSTASVADLETAAVNSPRILTFFPWGATTGPDPDRARETVQEIVGWHRKPPRGAASPQATRCGAARLCDFQVGGRLFAGAPVSLDLVRDLHSFRQAA